MAKKKKLQKLAARGCNRSCLFRKHTEATSGTGNNDCLLTVGCDSLTLITVTSDGFSDFFYLVFFKLIRSWLIFETRQEELLKRPVVSTNIRKKPHSVKSKIVWIIWISALLSCPQCWYQMEFSSWLMSNGVYLMVDVKWSFRHGWCQVECSSWLMSCQIECPS